MKRNTHLAIGLISTIPVLSFTGFASLIGILGAIVPDLDLILGKKYHRKFTHSILALTISTVFVVIFIDVNIGIVWGMAYLSHLLADSLTFMGVPFLYPLKKKRYGLRMVKTGDVTPAIFLGIICVILYFVFIR